jgi:hypothetical protein
VVTFGAFLLAAAAVHFLLRFAHRAEGGAVGLGRISPIAAARDGLSSRTAPTARRSPPPHNYPPLPENVNPEDVHIIYPTAEQAQAGLERLRTCVAQWAGKPALFVEDPDLALIVRLHTVMQGVNGFQLRMRVEEVIGAPADFDARAGLDRDCGWNQPYMSFNERGLSAPYCFYMHFGEGGVKKVREFHAELRAGNVAYTSMLRGALRGCFSAAAWEELHGDTPRPSRTRRTAAGAGSPARTPGAGE